jgi:hypothetical protein
MYDTIFIELDFPEKAIGMLDSKVIRLDILRYSETFLPLVLSKRIESVEMFTLSVVK